MSDTASETVRSSKLPLVIGILAFITFGGIGFIAVFSWKLLAPGHETNIDTGTDPSLNALELRFVSLEPLLVSINRTDPPRQLRLEAQLEVDPSSQRDVEAQIPRIMDAMNSYLRAVEMADLREPEALLRIRAQLLRRIQVIVGDGRVRGLLITKFLVS